LARAEINHTLAMRHDLGAEAGWCLGVNARPGGGRELVAHDARNPIPSRNPRRSLRTRCRVERERGADENHVLAELLSGGPAERAAVRDRL